MVGGFKHFLLSIIYGIILPIDYCIFFQDGSNHQPVTVSRTNVRRVPSWAWIRQSLCPNFRVKVFLHPRPLIRYAIFSIPWHLSDTSRSAGKLWVSDLSLPPLAQFVPRKAGNAWGLYWHQAVRRRAYTYVSHMFHICFMLAPHWITVDRVPLRSLSGFPAGSPRHGSRLWQGAGLVVVPWLRFIP